MSPYKNICSSHARLTAVLHWRQNTLHQVPSVGCPLQPHRCSQTFLPAVNILRTKISHAEPQCMCSSHFSAHSHSVQYAFRSYADSGSYVKLAASHLGNSTVKLVLVPVFLQSGSEHAAVVCDSLGLSFCLCLTAAIFVTQQ